MKQVVCYHCGNKKTGISVDLDYIENVLRPGAMTARCNKCGWQIVIYIGKGYSI